MNAYRKQVVDAFNSTVEAVREGALKEKQVTTASLWTFGEYPTGMTRTKIFNRPIATLQPLNLAAYEPYGHTPLYDAVGVAIRDLQTLADAGNPRTSFLLIVKTDGQESGSREDPSGDRLRALMQKVNATDRWTIVFMVPPGEGDRISRHLGIPRGNVREWEGSDRGVREAAVATVQGVSSYFVGRSHGQTQTKSFYTDLSDVKASSVKRKLDDVAEDFNVWNVPAEEDIASFAERRSRKEYRKGAGYYQLTKPELVQENKKLLVMEKGKKAVYGGRGARDVLGIPDGRIKIKPGNHAQWDIFVQSTSTNRKLVRGTKFLYEKP